MADDLPAGSVSLEDDAPAAPLPLPAGVAAPVGSGGPANDAPPVAGVEAEPEPDQVDGLLAALRAVRADNKGLKEKAARVDQLEQEVHAARPYVEFLRNNPGLTQQRQEPQAPPPDPAADPDALEAAQLMDFYTPDGKLDTARGAKWLKLQDGRAARTTQSTLQPMVQQTQEERAVANYRGALALKMPDGQTVNKQAFDALWVQLDRAQQADPNAVGLVALATFGAQGMMRKPGAPPVPPPAGLPVVTEGAGGTPRPAGRLSELERTIAKNRGIPEAKWQEHTKGHQAGRPMPLEDD